MCNLRKVLKRLQESKEWVGFFFLEGGPGSGRKPTGRIRREIVNRIKSDKEHSEEKWKKEVEKAKEEQKTALKRYIKYAKDTQKIHWHEPWKERTLEIRKDQERIMRNEMRRRSKTYGITWKFEDYLPDNEIPSEFKQRPK